MTRKVEHTFDTIPDTEYWSWVDKAEYLIRTGYVDRGTDSIDLARRMFNKRKEQANG